MYFEEKKHLDTSYEIPSLSKEGAIIFEPLAKKTLEYDKDAQVIKDLNTIWDVAKFRQEREPVSFGKLKGDTKKEFISAKAPHVMDMPIKFPGSKEFRVPKELAQFESTIREIAQIEATVNDKFEDYYCYITIDTRAVKPKNLQRESPCHVDGMQTSRQAPTLINHSYIVSSSVPTTFYKQPFMVDMLNLDKHNLFWELNRQVAMTNSHYAITHEPNEILLMDAYTVHRGTAVTADKPIARNWIRLSFEVRKFDRVGNTHNPLFDYDWKMEERDIDSWELEAYDPNCEASLRVYPWQALDGTKNPKGVITTPNLTPLNQNS